MSTTSGRVATAGLLSIAVAAGVVHWSQHRALSRVLEEQTAALVRLRESDDLLARAVGLCAARQVTLSKSWEREAPHAEAPPPPSNAQADQDVPTPPHADDTTNWEAYNRAKELLDRGLAAGTWTQEEADEFRVSAHASGTKMAELMRLRITAFNEQRLRGNFVP